MLIGVFEMIKLIPSYESNKYPKIIDNMFSLRARQFDARLGWKVKVNENGHEVDDFDDLDPLYVVSLGPDDSVLGTFRLLQTTGPHMLLNVFPELLPDGQFIRSPLVWESTRFCVDTEKVKQLSSRGLNSVTGELLSTLLEVGLYAGLTHIVTVIDVRMERVLLRAKCPVERLGEPVKIGKVNTIAILMECSERTVAEVHKGNEISERCITSEDLDYLGYAA